MSDSRLSQVHASFASALVRVVLNELKVLPKAWPTMLERDQQTVLDRLRNEMDKAIREGMARVLSAGFNHAEVGVDSIAIKGSVKITLSMSDASRLHEVVDSIGRKVVLALIDPAIFAEGLSAFKADADQGALPLEVPDTRDASDVDPRVQAAWDAEDAATGAPIAHNEASAEGMGGKEPSEDEDEDEPNGQIEQSEEQEA